MADKETVPLLMRVLAVWGAITGSTALAWDFYKWKTTGPRLRMTVSPNMVTATPGVGVDKTRNISINVTNVGTAKTTLRTLGVACYSSLWQRLRNRPAKTFVIVNVGNYCKAMPCVLEVGEIWCPFFPQDHFLQDLDKTHRIEFQLWHSASPKPVSTKLELPE